MPGPWLQARGGRQPPAQAHPAGRHWTGHGGPAPKPRFRRESPHISAACLEEHFSARIPFFGFLCHSCPHIQYSICLLLRNKWFSGPGVHFSLPSLPSGDILARRCHLLLGQGAILDRLSQRSGGGSGPRDQPGRRCSPGRPRSRAGGTTPPPPWSSCPCKGPWLPGQPSPDAGTRFQSPAPRAPRATLPGPLLLLILWAKLLTLNVHLTLASVMDLPDFTIGRRSRQFENPAGEGPGPRVVGGGR